MGIPKELPEAKYTLDIIGRTVDEEAAPMNITLASDFRDRFANRLSPLPARPRTPVAREVGGAGRRPGVTDTGG